MPEVIDECECPNCKKKIQKWILRRPYIAETQRVNENGHKYRGFKKVKGKYKWKICSSKTSNQKEEKNG